MKVNRYRFNPQAQASILKNGEQWVFVGYAVDTMQKIGACPEDRKVS